MLLVRVELDVTRRSLNVNYSRSNYRRKFAFSPKELLFLVFYNAQNGTVHLSFGLFVFDGEEFVLDTFPFVPAEPQKG